MQVAHAGGPFQIEVGSAIGAIEQRQFQARVADVASHASVPARIHHQPPQGAIRLDAQIHPAMGHLHRAGQQQAGAHRPPQQRGGEEREAMAAPGLFGGGRGGDRHQADPTAGGGGP